MGKPSSRVAQEVREAEQRVKEVQRKIKQLSVQVENPQKYFMSKTDEKTQSAIVRFRRYFMLDRISSQNEKRKPTRAEMRAQRHRAIFWSILAFIALVWVLGKLSQVMR